ncbi:MAG: CoA-binding protein [Bacteroidota bacterium]
MKATYSNWYDTKMRANEQISQETEEAEQLLNAVSTIAIVGISRNRHKDSNFVGRYLKNAGYTIIPVNPGADEILGEKSYPTLADIPFPVDVVDIFRRPDQIPQAVDDALAIQPKAIWLQLGTGTHPELEEKVESKAIHFFQNRCIKIDHQFLIRPNQLS